ncbi:ATPase, V1/A1 complex, subunit E [Catenaria anguillulae PL171]|uniref:ATPase, V1/A1 complex, subunit E n=1 Tax=Catenaria anguillulae PL171 TaxID=765915 RepID=A0A1Y2HCQ5_9FUNG|nr:ATPase, V1/A1 complex, subunit E [Catenaria anguillulae PL171]
MSRPLQDDEVQNEMKKMVAFIKQEALEKAKEIKIKADEEFNIEKAKIVRQETATIDALFQKKMKQFEVQRKIAASNHTNKAKVKVLQKRHDLLAQTFNDTRAQLETLTADQPKYKELIKGLLVQSFLELLETDVVVQCVERDVLVVNSVLDEAKKQYEEIAGAKVNATVDTSSPLPASAIGGVIVSSNGGRIKVLNSLESRLQIASDQLLPDIRVTLYGVPPNRRFFD